MGAEAVIKRSLLELVTIVQHLSDEELIVYRCLKKLPSGGYVVQNADRVRIPIDRKMLRDQETLFWELLIEQGPGVRDNFVPTIEEAIDDFNAQFE